MRGRRRLRQRPPARTLIESGTASVRLAPSPRTGPAASTVRVSGTGFGAYKAVGIYFDATEVALAKTNARGAFSGTAVGVPASALPSKHYLTAVQRHPGRGACVDVHP